MDAQIGFSDALRRIFPTALARYLPFRGWIRQETWRHRIAVTFDLRRCASNQSWHGTGQACRWFSLGLFLNHESG